jgi:hypothetical protein
VHAHKCLAFGCLAEGRAFEVREKHKKKHCFFVKEQARTGLRYALAPSGVQAPTKEKT